MGSINRTERNGNIRFVARVYDRRTGKQPSKTFTTERAAKKWVADREGVRTATPERRDRESVSKAVRRYLDAATTAGTRGTRKHLLENLGDLEWQTMDDVTTDDVRGWLVGLADGREWADGKALGRSTCNTMLSILSSVFNDAVAQGHLSRNPAKHVKRLTVAEASVEPHQIITPDQVRAIVAAADEPLASIVRFMAATGIRPGEIGGLRIRSVDPYRRIVSVTEQADGRYSAWDWKPTKTVQAVRTVPLTPSALWVAQMNGGGGSPGAPLFLTETGGQWSTSHIRGRFVAAAEKAGVEGFTPKSLRHLYASALIADGVSPVAVSKLMGHASPTITLDVYSHLFPGDQEAARSAVEGHGF